MTMEYYKLLDFTIEPFSNSPDPRLFYHSRQHLEVLQKLEISIRLKRGLNVVIGDIGTGKTTVSRQLIQELSKDRAIEYHLILDPGFSSVQGFLTYILGLLVQEIPEEIQDENSLKESIKAHLFIKGIDKNINIVLVIDEGQKLSLENLEVLRELLNFETNDQKLLQMVIFAQNEFEESLDKVKNFQDRINFKYNLTSLNFKESKGLIQYRLNQSFAREKQHPVFSATAFIAIYWATKGSPRKIVTLCHQVLLALITRDKKKAGFFLIRSCVKESPYFKKSRQVPVLSTFIVLTVIVLAGIYYSGYFVKKSQKPILETPSVISKSPAPDTKPDANPLKKKTPSITKPVVLAKKKPAIHTPATQPAEAGVPVVAMPLNQSDQSGPSGQSGPSSKDTYGSILVPANATVYSMISLVYGEFTPELLSQVMAFNSSISSPGKVLSGLPMYFPVPREKKEYPDHMVFLLILQTRDFNRAFTVAASARYNDLDVRILPFQSQDKGYNFNVIINKPFENQEEALAFLGKIEPGISAVPGNVISLKTNYLMDKG
jgi:general secretion pathway protein A